LAIFSFYESDEFDRGIIPAQRLLPKDWNFGSGV
jgi:hypothetical protein